MGLEQEENSLRISSSPTKAYDCGKLVNSHPTPRRSFLSYILDLVLELVGWTVAGVLTIIRSVITVLSRISLGVLHILGWIMPFVNAVLSAVREVIIRVLTGLVHQYYLIIQGLGRDRAL
mmetsp:Transcript_13852/g.28391  ORF Transcript_13852/g.28391 Transcript_13852/m.28391 type:complete len:120 (-) Transcript_13852:229-588(-)